MPSKGSRFTGPLEQTAVYWGGPTDDGYGGRTFDSAVEIDVRWEQRQEMFHDSEGREVLSQAVIFAAVDLDEGGYLFLGDLDDLDSGEEADPQTVGVTADHDRAFEIRAFKKTPDRKAIEWERKAWL